MSTTLILETPPRICQKVIYGNEESEMACWATTAEMITKWKNPNAFFVRPKFEDKLLQSERDILVKSHLNPNAPPQFKKYQMANHWLDKENIYDS